MLLFLCTRVTMIRLQSKPNQVVGPISVSDLLSIAALGNMQNNITYYIYLYTVFEYRTIHKLTSSNAHTYNKLQYINIKNNNKL